MLALTVTLFAAAVQGVVGVGFAMVSVPVLALIDPALAPVPQLLVTVPLTVAMAWRERSHMDIAGVGWIIGGRIPGALLGLALLAVATQATLDLAIAALVLVGVAILGSGYHVQRNAATKFGAGVLSGTAGLVASVGGPPLALIYSREEGATVRASLAAVFTIGLLITITARAVTGNISGTDVRVALVLFPALAGGWALSTRLAHRVRQETLRLAILGLSAIAAAGLVARAFTG